jgi:hypothetical protein
MSSSTTPNVVDIMRQQYPNHTQIETDSIAQNIYIERGESDLADDSEIVFVEQTDINDQAITINPLKIDNAVLTLLANKRTQLGYLTNLVSEIKLTVNPTTASGIFACIVRDILAAQFKHHPLAHPGRRGVCMPIRHTKYWNITMFTRMARKLTNLIFGYKERTMERMTEIKCCIQASKTDRIIWKQFSNLFIGLDASDIAIPIRDSSIEQCDPDSTLLQQDTFLLFHTYNTPSGKDIVAMYISNNLLPILSPQEQVYADEDTTPEIYSYTLNPDAIKIRFGARLSELVQFTKNILKDKTKLYHVIAGLIQAKVKFNSGELLDAYSEMYCSLDLLDSNTLQATLIKWTEYITAQYDIDTLNSPSDGGDNESKGDEDQAPDADAEDTLYKVQINSILCNHTQMDRRIDWYFINDPSDRKVMINESCNRDFDAYTVERQHQPGNPHDIESHFSLEETMSRMLAYLDAAAPYIH